MSASDTDAARPEPTGSPEAVEPSSAAASRTYTIETLHVASNANG